MLTESDGGSPGDAGEGDEFPNEPTTVWTGAAAPPDVDDTGVGLALKEAEFTDGLRKVLAGEFELPDEIAGAKEKIKKQYIHDHYLFPLAELMTTLCERGRVLTEPQLYLNFIQLLFRRGEYRLGAQMGALIYDSVKDTLPDSDTPQGDRDMLLRDIVAAASWMHYVSVKESDRDSDAFDKWLVRAQELTDRFMVRTDAMMPPGRNELLSSEQTYLIKQCEIGKIMMDLLKAFMNWKRGQFFEQGSDRANLCGQAVVACNMALSKDRLWRGELSETATPRERQIRNIFTADPEYLAVVADVRRMKAMLLNRQYFWDTHWQMEDDDTAEEALGDDATYATALFPHKSLSGEQHERLPFDEYYQYKKAVAVDPGGSRKVFVRPLTTEETAALSPQERDNWPVFLFREYLEFCKEHRPADPVRQSQLQYAYLSQIRGYKLLNQHDVAHDFGEKVKNQAEQSGEPIFLARIFNTLADNILVLGRKLMSRRFGGKEEENLVRQAGAILEIPEGQPRRMPTATCAKLLFAKAREYTAIALERGDVSTRRIARSTSANAALSLFPLEMDAAQKRQLITEIWDMFINEERLFAFDDHEDLAVFQTNKFEKGSLWALAEAPILMQIYVLGKRIGLTLPVADYWGKWMPHLAGAYAELRREVEASRQKPNVPGSYYALVKHKMDFFKQCSANAEWREELGFGDMQFV